MTSIRKSGCNQISSGGICNRKNLCGGLDEYNMPQSYCEECWTKRSGRKCHTESFTDVCYTKGCGRQTSKTYKSISSGKWLSICLHCMLDMINIKPFANTTRTKTKKTNQTMQTKQTEEIMNKMQKEFNELKKKLEQLEKSRKDIERKNKEQIEKARKDKEQKDERCCCIRCNYRFYSSGYLGSAALCHRCRVDSSLGDKKRSRPADDLDDPENFIELAKQKRYFELSRGESPI